MLARCRLLLVVLGAQVLACGAKTSLQDPPHRTCGGGPVCEEPEICCGATCVDPTSDPDHCGSCDAACAPFPFAGSVCAAGVCAMGPCEPGHVDCNASPADGCEIPATSSPCACVPGESGSCYDGPPGTEGVATCKAGVHVCDATASWGPCTGQVLPLTESCNGADDDCDGVIDFLDTDGDGWTFCDGDCCETPEACAADPHLVNPGAFDVPDNGVDDDCDPSTLDSGAMTCDPTPLAAPTAADDLVRAIDLCQHTAEEAPLPERRWGVLSSELVLADGTAGPPSDLQAGVLAAYGTLVKPKKSATMAALSSGTARAEGDPGFVHPQNGGPTEKGNFDALTFSGVPKKWLDANFGVPPPPPGCAPCTGGSCAQANDPIDLHVKIRVPTNAATFTLWHKFYTAEYPEFACVAGSDRFVALHTTGAPTCTATPRSPDPCVPVDTNIAFDSHYSEVSADSFFDVCVIDGSQPPGSCPLGHFELFGTGMGGWDGDVANGAATTWIQALAPVVPGETMELELVIWDAKDHNVDSLVLVDGFEWHEAGGDAE